MKIFLLSIALTLAASGFAQETPSQGSSDVSTTSESTETSATTVGTEADDADSQTSVTEGAEVASETATEGDSEAAAIEASSTEGAEAANETTTEGDSEAAATDASSAEAAEEASETAVEGDSGAVATEDNGTEGSKVATGTATEVDSEAPERDAATAGSDEAAYDHPLPARCHHPGDVSLTFDDGPGQYTGDVLATLKKNQVVATFHVAKKMLGDSEMVEKLKEAMADGHNIGLRFDPAVTAEALAAMSPEEFHQKLVTESESFRHHFGVYPRLLRMPYGYRHLDKSYHDIVNHKGFIVSGWTIDSNDYAQELSPEALVEIAYDPILLVDEESKEHFGQIEESFIVLHRDIYDISVALDAGINLVKAEGAGRLRFVTLGECLDVDNVYKRDVEGQHGFVGADGKPVASRETELYDPEEDSEPDYDPEDNPEPVDDYEEYPGPVDEVEGDQEVDVSVETENEVAPEEETSQGGQGDFTQNLAESTGGAHGYGGIGSTMVFAALAAVFA